MIDTIDDKLATLRHAIEGGVKEDSAQSLKLMELVDDIGERFKLELADANTGEPKLSVWYGSMPESNGKTNWTAILHKGDIASGMTIDRSEYPDRVRYEADRVRWLIGELSEDPFILDYDADKHSGYVAPSDDKIVAAHMGYGAVSVGSCFSPEANAPGIVYMALEEPCEIDTDTTDVHPVGSPAKNVLACVTFKDAAAVDQTIEILQELKAKHFGDVDYEALEREHLGDSEKRTGIYAAPAVDGEALQAFNAAIARALRNMAGDMRAEQTFLGSCRESCDDSGRVRWVRIQRVIDYFDRAARYVSTAEPVEMHAGLVLPKLGEGATIIANGEDRA